MYSLGSVRSTVENASRQWVGLVVLSGVLAYAVLFVLNVLLIVLVAYLEPLHGLSTLERSELHQLATFGGISAEYEAPGGLVGGVEPSYTTGNYLEFNEDVFLWIALSGLAYAAMSYLSASVIGHWTNARSHVATAVAGAVPFAFLALWRATAFGTRVSYGNAFTAEPVRTFVGALLFALVFGLVGGGLARWRRG